MANKNNKKENNVLDLDQDLLSNLNKVAHIDEEHVFLEENVNNLINTLGIKNKRSIQNNNLKR
ncbi:hypothetical protein Cyrtocomes_00660 [Candidatus Cyrtobacter comes]|uniref:Uncharacterized protein n=1 Tax=Candidatus Cyrtobacter comes TaxID=675776 RepID=A0ABU5L827_9RICK|nr:hypothetical protein [Candidatus Cyrtobacter comes]MDZ5762281.1 hypothetical protein [Candidatus Cyrtobacter comes]